MLQTISKSDKRSILRVSGSIQVVEEGQVSSPTLHPIHRNQFRFALGEGSFSDESCVGEALVLDSKRFVSYMQDGKLKTESRDNFCSPFLVGLDPSQPMGELVQYKEAPPITLQSLYEKLLKVYANGFAIVGYGLAKEVQSTYLKKPPTSKVNTAVHSSGYVSQALKHKDQGISFFGVVLSTGARSKFAKSLGERLFSHNFPESDGGSFSSRTNVAILGSDSIVLPKENHSFLESIKNSSVTSVGHMMVESLIEEGAFAIFPIEDIRSEEKPPKELKHCRETLRYPFTSAPQER